MTILREQIRGKSLDDDCKEAKISRNEYGPHDHRCFCYGLIDCSTEDYLEKCVKCRAFVFNAKPLPGEETERIRDKRLDYMIESLTKSVRPVFVSDCVSALRELKERRESDKISCDAIKKDENGKCEGYQKSDTDDEPAEKCMECPKNIFYEGDK